MSIIVCVLSCCSNCNDFSNDLKGKKRSQEERERGVGREGDIERGSGGRGGEKKRDPV